MTAAVAFLANCAALFEFPCRDEQDAYVNLDEPRAGNRRSNSRQLHSEHCDPMI
jgi:hypothetical protein